MVRIRVFSIIISLQLSVISSFASAKRDQSQQLQIRLLIPKNCPLSIKKNYHQLWDKKWQKAHLKALKEIFQKHKIKIDVAYQKYHPKRCELTTRAHRHAMAEHIIMDGRLSVLLVPRVQDVDVPSYNLMGVHWRYKGKKPLFKKKRYVLLSARAKPPVLAHEICHYLGLPHYSEIPNLMMAGPSDPRWKKNKRPKGFSSSLTPKQVKRLKAGLKAFNLKYRKETL